MDISQLVAAGLNAQQAEVYALLLENGQMQPKVIAERLKVTRTNAYKLLDKLVDQGLLKRQEVGKKFVYQPTSPLALTNLTYAERNKLVAREQAIQKMMDDLLRQYYKHNERPLVSQVSGHEAVVSAYKQQVELRQDVYFIRSLADISSMSFESMQAIRLGPLRYGRKRSAITPDGVQASVMLEGAKDRKLDRTWIKQEDYTAPVEWSVSGDMLLIVLFGSEPHAITIINPVIADAFHQIFQLLESSIQAMKYYKNLPRR